MPVFKVSTTLFLQVLKESFKIYCAINDGIINLVDVVGFHYGYCLLDWITCIMYFYFSLQYNAHPLSFLQFFDMSRHDAMKALNVYKRAGKQVYNVLWIFFLTIWIAVNFFLCSMWMKFIFGNLGLLVFLLYRLKILLIFMTVARVWILLGTISFHLWDRFLFCLKKMTSTLYLKACFYKPCFLH